MQLQRLVHEELGVGTWARCVDSVPVTVDGRQRLAVLDISDLEHPRMKAPAPAFDEILAVGEAAMKHNAVVGEAEGDEGSRSEKTKKPVGKGGVSGWSRNLKLF